MIWSESNTWRTSDTWNTSGGFSQVAQEAADLKALDTPAATPRAVFDDLSRVTVVAVSNIYADTEIGNVLNAGYILEKIYIVNVTGFDCQISCGTSDRGVGIFKNEAIGASGKAVISASSNDDFTTDRSIFVHDDGGNGDTWSSAKITMYFYLIKIIV